MTPTRFSLSVSFKGDRTYLQSADIFNEIVAHTGAMRGLSLSFRHLLSHGLDAIDAGSCDDPSSFPARFRGDGVKGKIDLVISETGRTISERIPYDEEAVVQDSEIAGFSISSRSGGDASLMERIVALNKRLIHQTLKPGKKLLFTNVILTELLPPDAPLTLTLDAHLGSRLFRSSIHSGVKIGEIAFYGV